MNIMFGDRVKVTQNGNTVEAIILDSMTTPWGTTVSADKSMRNLMLGRTDTKKWFATINLDARTTTFIVEKI